MFRQEMTTNDQLNPNKSHGIDRISNKTTIEMVSISMRRLLGYELCPQEWKVTPVEMMPKAQMY